MARRAPATLEEQLAAKECELLRELDAIRKAREVLQRKRSCDPAVAVACDASEPERACSAYASSRCCPECGMLFVRCAMHGGTLKVRDQIVAHAWEAHLVELDGD